VVEARLPEHVENAAGGARLRVGGAVDDPREARQDDRAGAHRARLEGHVEDRVRNPPPPEIRSGLAEREDLGVRRGVSPKLALVSRRGEHLPLSHDHGADRDVVVIGGTLRLAQRETHELLVPAEEALLAHA
jgi:hypothetical protein